MRASKCYRVVAKFVTPDGIAKAMTKRGLMRSAPLDRGERTFCAPTPQMAGRDAERDLTGKGLHVVSIEVYSSSGKLIHRRKPRGA